MSERDYNRQVVKRESIGRETLVIGVDVGNAWNAVGFMNKEGNDMEINPTGSGLYSCSRSMVRICAFVTITSCTPQDNLSDR